MIGSAGLSGAFGAGERAHLQPILARRRRRSGRRLRSGRAPCMPTPRRARVHHHEHRRQALVRLADQRADRRRRGRSAQVALPWMPILCSRPPQQMPLRSPSEPSALTMNFGTTNSEMPFEPAGASGRRASTRWTMFSAQVVLAGGDEDLVAGDLVACRRPAARPWCAAGRGRCRTAARSGTSCRSSGRSVSLGR